MNLAAITNTADKDSMLNLIADPQQSFAIDGPIARIHQLCHHEVYRQTIHDFLNCRLDWRKWPHQLRNSYRMHMWTKTARERSQHFDGIQHGVNRQLTLALLNELALHADTVQH